MRGLSLLTNLVSLLTVSLAAPTSKDVSSLATVTDVLTDAPLQPGKVRICNGRGGRGHCVEVKAHLKCMQLSAPIRFNVQSLVQSKGNFCSYSQGKKCNNSAFVVDSSKSEQSIDVIKWSRDVTGVQCISGPSLDSATAADESTLPVHAELVTKFHAHFDNGHDHDHDDNTPGVTSYAAADDDNTRPLASRSSATSLSPAGDALLCSGPITTGPCSKIPSNHQCIILAAPVAYNVRMIYQNKGSVCEYFEDRSCTGRLGSSDSTRNSLQSSVPDQIAGRISAAKCRLTTMIATIKTGETGEAGVEFVAPLVVNEEGDVQGV